MAGWLLDLELSHFGLSKSFIGGDPLSSVSLPSLGWKWGLSVSGVAHTLRQILQIQQKLVNVIIPMCDSFGC